MPDKKPKEKRDVAPKEKGMGSGKTTHTSGQKPIEEPKEEPKEEKTKKRTKKQFKKLTKSNKELKKERDQYKSVLDSLKPKVPPVQPQQPTRDVPQAETYSHLKQDDIDDVFSGMMDKEGYVDGNKLMGALKSMNERAVRAEKQVETINKSVDARLRQQRDFEESRIVREVHEKHPQLDPESDDFNEEYFDSVRNEMIGQMMQGKQDFMAAADKWYKRYYKEEVEEVATKKQKEEATEKEEAKRQINATQPKPTAGTVGFRDYELEALKEETMKGKKGALAERLRRSGHGPT
jgi:hypothetical protein